MILVAALVMLGISMAGRAGTSSNPNNPGELDPSPIATTLREFIVQGSDPVDDEIAEALQRWSSALNGN